jgi:hypothetical protein
MKGYYLLEMNFKGILRNAIINASEYLPTDELFNSAARAYGQAEQ